MTQKRPSDSKSKGPVTLKEALSENVKDQQRRSERTASPEEAKRPARERVRDSDSERKRDEF